MEKNICDYCSNDSGDDDDYGGESLSVYDATLIWRSSGEDEDRTFGYTEEELSYALDD